MSVNPEDDESEQLDLKRLRQEIAETHCVVQELRQQVQALRDEHNERLRRSMRDSYRRAQSTIFSLPPPPHLRAAPTSRLPSIPE